MEKAGHFTRRGGIGSPKGPEQTPPTESRKRGLGSLEPLALTLTPKGAQGPSPVWGEGVGVAGRSLKAVTASSPGWRAEAVSPVRIQFQKDKAAAGLGVRGAWVSGLLSLPPGSSLAVRPGPALTRS